MVLLLLNLVHILITMHHPSYFFLPHFASFHTHNLVLICLWPLYLQSYAPKSVILLQNGLDTKVEKSRKQMKERKNRAKKIRGVKKVSILHMFFRICEIPVCLRFLFSLFFFPRYFFVADKGFRCCQGWQKEVRVHRILC